MASPTPHARLGQEGEVPHLSPLSSAGHSCSDPGPPGLGESLGLRWLAQSCPVLGWWVAVQDGVWPSLGAEAEERGYLAWSLVLGLPHQCQAC